MKIDITRYERKHLDAPVRAPSQSNSRDAELTRLHVENARLRAALEKALSLAAAAIIDRSPLTQAQIERTAELVALHGNPAALTKEKLHAE